MDYKEAGKTEEKPIKKLLCIGEEATKLEFKTSYASTLRNQKNYDLGKQRIDQMLAIPCLLDIFCSDLKVYSVFNLKF